MGIFDRLKGKREDDFSADMPPDFSQLPGENQPRRNKQGDDFLGTDPLYGEEEGASPYGEAGRNNENKSGFDHDIFSSNTPTNAENARSYAQNLGNRSQGFTSTAQNSGAQQTYAGAITGHESQLILERLDTIKAELDSIKQRMMRLEQSLERQEPIRRRSF